MKKFHLYWLFCTMLFFNGLYAEVEQITIRWTAQLCQSTCIKLLEKEFKKIHGINEIVLDQGNGQATLTWKKNIPFQFTSINTAMHMIGLSMREVRIKVSGNVHHTGELFYIISSGDNTRFDLVNPDVSHPNGQTGKSSANAQKISSELQLKLLEGEKQKQIATIEGPVFMPKRMVVPTQIVLDQLNFTNP